MNNGIMGGYGQWMPDAVSRYSSSSLERRLRRHRASARRPRRASCASRRSCRPALERSIASVAAGRATLLEVMTHEEPDQPGVAEG